MPMKSIPEGLELPEKKEKHNPGDGLHRPDDIDQEIERQVEKRE